MSRIFVIFALILSLIGCVTALDLKGNVEIKPEKAALEQLYNHGIGQPWVRGNPPGQQGQDYLASGGYSETNSATFSRYSQYFTIPKGNAPKMHIEAPTRHDIEGKTPTTVYFSYKMQAMPYSQYQTYAPYKVATPMDSRFDKLDSVSCHSSRCKLITSGDLFCGR